MPTRLAQLAPSDRRRLTDPPPIDRLVVCHGDAGAPNTLIDDGRCCGHVGLGDFGVADPVGRSGGGLHELLDAYGVAADPTRDYYQRLWQAGDISSR